MAIGTASPAMYTELCYSQIGRRLCSDKTLLSSFVGVPSDHWGLTGLYRSSRQGAVPLLYELPQQMYRQVQNCLWFGHSLWLVRSTFVLQSLRRKGRQVCGFRELS
jgi:hypothetical protein